MTPEVGGSEYRPWLLVPVAALGGLVVGWLTSRFAPEAAGAVVRAYQPGGRVRGRTALVTVGTGGSGGREGPMVQVGGIGAWLAGRVGFNAAESRSSKKKGGAQLPLTVPVSVALSSACSSRRRDPIAPTATINAHHF